MKVQVLLVSSMSGGPRLIMTVGSVVGPLGVVLVALAPNLAVLTVGWVIAGLAQSAVLYQAAFTVIARRYGLDAAGR